MKIRFLPSCAAALLVMACSQTPRVHVDPETGRADVDVEPAGLEAEEWTGGVRGLGQWSRMSGTVTAHVGSDMTDVEVSVTGAPDGPRIPWHVHEGTCAEPMGPIVGPPSAYEPLTVSPGGMARGRAQLAGVQLNEARQYHVNFHRSPTEMATIIACAELDD
ncbi:MAG TPA: hypothetical protein VHG08_07535 [Longimicrobium sp.]|nr:hypothetical protein [Longimicrobium sp.]